MRSYLSTSGASPPTPPPQSRARRNGGCFAPLSRLHAGALLSLLVVLAACDDGPGANSPNRSQLADKWLVRARQSFKNGDVEDATQAIDGALKAAPKDPDTHLLAARIALSKLDFQEAIKQTEGMESSDAKAVRGRAFWYEGDIERAADELEDMLRDPNVKDPWARDVAKLARRGQGRHPFAIEGGVVAAVEMPQGGPALVVPCELEGERILALVATNFGEVMIDSSFRKEPAWVNLRFGDKFEVKDVPALTYDLSNISRQMGGQIKALLGVNVLRHMHATVDRHGSQFVVRKSEPAPPPAAARLPVVYAKGGAMLLHAQVSNKPEGSTMLFVDSSAFYPLALDESTLKKSGADVADFKSEPGAPPNWRMGPLPFFKLGDVDLSQFPTVTGPSTADYKQTFDVDFGGIAGAGLLSIFRITWADEGKWLYLELDPTVMNGQAQQGAPPPGPPGPPGPVAPGPDNGPPGKLELTPPAPLPPPSGPGPQSKKPEPSKAPKKENKGAAGQ